MQTRMICWIVFIIVYSPITSASYKVIQTLLLSPDDRGTIVLPPGKYELERGLSLFADNVILSGSGQHETILSFREQKSGGEGLLIKGKNITIKNLVIINAPGEGLKVRDSENVIIKNIKVGWNEGLKPTNGAYAIYPVSSRHVKISRCETFGASEAGIYLGQTVYGEVSDNITYHNVVGIEVENSQKVMIKNNRIHENSIGLLISDIPGLRIMGRDTNIDGNTILDNNLENFSSNFSHLGRDQSGIGLLLIGVKELVVQNNQFNGHGTTHLGIINYLSSKFPRGKMTYNPNVMAIKIKQNIFKQEKKFKETNRRFFQWPVKAMKYDVLWDKKVTLDVNAPTFKLHQRVCFSHGAPALGAVDATQHFSRVSDSDGLLCQNL